MDYISIALGNIYTMWQAYLSGAYVNNVNIYIPGLLVILLIAVSSCELYMLTVVSYVHMY